MGSLDRKIKRAQKRREFEEFTSEWQHFKRTGQQVNGQDLGKKPGYGVFLSRMKAREGLEKIAEETKQKEKVEEEKKLDLEWKDE